MNLAVLCTALGLGALVPSLLATNLPPSPTLLNQAAAWACWGLVATSAMRHAVRALPLAAARAAPVSGALLLVALSALGAWLFGELPEGLAVSGAGTVLAAAALAVLGAAMAPQRAWWACWFGAWALAAALNGVAGVVQVFAPEWADGDWIARVIGGGRAVGNLRQPNHLASLLLWGAVSVVALVELGPLARSPARRAAGIALMAFLVAGVMLTGSRTGMVGVGLLLVWGLVDRRLQPMSRALLLTAPVVYALSWWLAKWWSGVHAGPAIGAAARVGQAEVTTGRAQTWRNALDLIAQQPWTGAGYGEFNLAWTLTPFPNRWPEFFDHTHNLPLQILAEMGVVVGGLVVAALLWALWAAFTRTRFEGPDGTAARAFFMTLLLMGLHSLLEYPLWYAYFLLPTAFACGVCLGMTQESAAAREKPAWWTMVVGVALVVGATLMVVDYRRVSAIFAPSESDKRTLVERIKDGQRSWFFAHHADYAHITALEETAPPTTADFRRATHYLLDTRLLTAWARAYAREGDVERAHWIADRLRELKQPTAEPFFAPCSDATVSDKPFQCTPAQRTFSWRDFR